MDDLAGLDWTQPAKKQTSNTPAAFLPFRQSPTPQLSGGSTPLAGLPVQQSGPRASPAASNAFKPPSKPATPANDSFAGLVSLNSGKPAASNLSLQERQKQIQEEKQRQEAERRKQYDATFGSADSRHWDTLGSGKNTPEPTSFGGIRPPPTAAGSQGLSRAINKPFVGLDTTSKRPVQSQPADDDILAAFNKAAPVDASSHFPPAAIGSGRSTPALSTNVSRGHTPLPHASSSTAFVDDDDDMFGLKQMAHKPASPAPAPQTSDGDEDILGLLGKPVSEFEQQRKAERQAERERGRAPAEARRPSPRPMSDNDKAVAELVDMGFSADKSAIALATTESGLDVQAAVGWLLNQAHAEAKQKTQGRAQAQPRHSPDQLDERPRRNDSRSGARKTRESEPVPAWMKGDEGRSRSNQRGQEGGGQDKDVTQLASDIGSSLFKSANSLWKTGRKQVQKAVADFQQDGGDPNVPKWMRDAQAAEAAPHKAQKRRADLATDEAMMLEAGGRPPKPLRPSEMRQHADPLPVRQRRQQEGGRNVDPDRMSSRSPAPRQQTPTLDKRPATRLTRQEVEEQSAQAYISPSRRKKTAPQPQVDLFSPEPTPPAESSRQPPPTQSKNPFLQATSAPKPRTAARTPSPPRPRAPSRRIPPVSSSALSSSSADRQRGSDAFKRGDYAAAHAAYTSALSPLPKSHPVTIVVLCNRAVTNIKVGEPKAAVADADLALEIIGVSRGEGEKIATGGIEGEKDMKDFYGKALMRKAEALENMEKWSDAHKVWKEAVQNGVGGAISISGRNRCEKAASGGNKTAAARPPPARKPAATRPSAMSDLGGGAAKDSEAVKRMKAANAAAEKADDEKFALTDQVDAKLIAWKGTKADNLRALLGSLDKVLWPEAGWNKVNMGDLVMPNKVKIIYMKAIAKVHPDKVYLQYCNAYANTDRVSRFHKQPQSSRG